MIFANVHRVHEKKNEKKKERRTHNTTVLFERVMRGTHFYLDGLSLIIQVSKLDKCFFNN